MIQMLRKHRLKLTAGALLLSAALLGGPGLRAEDNDTYRLGPEDQVSIRVANLEKLQLDNASAPRINVNGDLDLPEIGHLHAAGMTLAELKTEIAHRLSGILNDPRVSVSIYQYRNHPVSVLGSVRNPGVFQVPHSKRLLEVLSLAGGLTPEAGDKIKISRPRNSSAPDALPHAVDDAESGTIVGTIDVRALLRASEPGLNILVADGDVISIPKADLIYVMGAVKKAGGFALGDRAEMSVLQALSMAEGLDRASAPSSARLLREEVPGHQRTEIPLNLKPILAGHAPDMALRPNDILFIPTSGAKMVSMRALEAAIQVGTGYAVFH